MNLEVNPTSSLVATSSLVGVPSEIVYIGLSLSVYYW